MIVISYTLSTPSAQTTEWTINTDNGFVEVNGFVSGSTTLKIRLAHGKLAEIEDE